MGGIVNLADAIERAENGRDVLTTKEVSAEYPFPEATLRWMRHCDRGPASFKLGRRVLYRRSDVEEWIAEQEAATRRGGSGRAA
ncbi:helix-turn-helix domain-containing protein [Rhodococcus hoagii]|nr:helix-turn-helix domain-containing protein [Prescottella equi]NKW46457.1 helix-turn-helix domain-containing protein [Prescottella equi]